MIIITCHNYWRECSGEWVAKVMYGTSTVWGYGSTLDSALADSADTLSASYNKQIKVII